MANYDKGNKTFTFRGFADNIGRFGAGAAKTMTKALTSTIKSYTPAISSSIYNTKELVRDAANFVKENRPDKPSKNKDSIVRNMSKGVRRSFDLALDDAKHGDLGFTGVRNEIADYLDTNVEDEWDFDSFDSDDDFNFEDEQGSSFTASDFAEGIYASTNATITATEISTREIISNNYKSLDLATNKMIASNLANMTKINSNFIATNEKLEAINTNLVSLVEYNNTTMNKFIENMTQHITKHESFMDEMINIARQMSGANRKKEEKRDNGGIFDNGFDPRKFMEKFFETSTGNTVGQIAAMGSMALFGKTPKMLEDFTMGVSSLGELVKMMNPAKDIIKFLLPSLADLKGIDKMFSDLTTIVADKARRGTLIDPDSFSNAFLSKLAGGASDILKEIFDNGIEGVDRKVASDDAVPWTEKDENFLQNVIPDYLSTIELSLDTIQRQSIENTNTLVDAIDKFRETFLKVSSFNAYNQLPPGDQSDKMRRNVDRFYNNQFATINRNKIRASRVKGNNEERKRVYDTSSGKMTTVGNLKKEYTDTLLSAAMGNSEELKRMLSEIFGKKEDELSPEEIKAQQELILKIMVEGRDPFTYQMRSFEEIVDLFKDYMETWTGDINTASEMEPDGNGGMRPTKAALAEQERIKKLKAENMARLENNMTKLYAEVARTGEATQKRIESEMKKMQKTSMNHFTPEAFDFFDYKNIKNLTNDLYTRIDKDKHLPVTVDQFTSDDDAFDTMSKGSIKHIQMMANEGKISQERAEQEIENSQKELEKLRYKQAQTIKQGSLAQSALNAAPNRVLSAVLRSTVGALQSVGDILSDATPDEERTISVIENLDKVISEIEDIGGVALLDEETGKRKKTRVIKYNTETHENEQVGGNFVEPEEHDTPSDKPHHLTGATNIDKDKDVIVHKGEMILDPKFSDKVREAMAKYIATGVMDEKLLDEGIDETNAKHAGDPNYKAVNKTDFKARAKRLIGKNNRKKVSGVSFAAQPMNEIKEDPESIGDLLIQRIVDISDNLRAIGNNFLEKEKEDLRQHQKDWREGVNRDLFGHKDENGMYHKGLLSNATNRIKDKFNFVRHGMTGKGYTGYKRDANGNVMFDDQGNPLMDTYDNYEVATKENYLKYQEENYKEWKKKYDRDTEIESQAIFSLGEAAEYEKQREKDGTFDAYIEKMAKTGGLKTYSEWTSEKAGESKQNQFINFLQSTVEDVSDHLGLTVDSKAKTGMDKAVQYLGKNAPTLAAGGLAGLAGNIVLGMSMGPAVGFGAAILASSDKFKDMLLGTKNEDGSRNGGLIGKDLQDNVKNNWKKYLVGGIAGSAGFGALGKIATGAIGTLTGGLASGGILGQITSVACNPLFGAFLGIATTVAAQDETIQETLFGKEENGVRKGGIVGDFKKAAMSVIDPLRESIFGADVEEHDDDGKPILDANGNVKTHKKGGLINQFKNFIGMHVFKPIKGLVSEVTENAVAWVKEDLLYSIKRVAAPLTHAMTELGNNLASGAKGIVDQVMSDIKKVFNPIGKLLTKVGDMAMTMVTGTIKAVTSMAMGAISAPLKILGGLLGGRKKFGTTVRMMGHDLSWGVENIAHLGSDLKSIFTQGKLNDEFKVGSIAEKINGGLNKDLGSPKNAAKAASEKIKQLAEGIKQGMGDFLDKHPKIKIFAGWISSIPILLGKILGKFKNFIGNAYQGAKSKIRNAIGSTKLGQKFLGKYDSANEKFKQFGENLKQLPGRIPLVGQAFKRFGSRSALLSNAFGIDPSTGNSDDESYNAFLDSRSRFIDNQEDLTDFEKQQLLLQYGNDENGRMRIKREQSKRAGRRAMQKKMNEYASDIAKRYGYGGLENIGARNINKIKKDLNKKFGIDASDWDIQTLNKWVYNDSKTNQKEKMQEKATKAVANMEENVQTAVLGALDGGGKAKQSETVKNMNENIQKIADNVCGIKDSIQEEQADEEADEKSAADEKAADEKKEEKEKRIEKESQETKDVQNSASFSTSDKDDDEDKDDDDDEAKEGGEKKKSILAKLVSAVTNIAPALSGVLKVALPAIGAFVATKLPWDDIFKAARNVAGNIGQSISDNHVDTHTYVDSEGNTATSSNILMNSEGKLNVGGLAGKMAKIGILKKTGTALADVVEKSVLNTLDDANSPLIKRLASKAYLELENITHHLFGWLKKIFGKLFKSKHPFIADAFEFISKKVDKAIKWFKNTKAATKLSDILSRFAKKEGVSSCVEVAGKSIPIAAIIMGAYSAIVNVANAERIFHIPHESWFAPKVLDTGMRTIAAVFGIIENLGAAGGIISLALDIWAAIASEIPTISNFIGYGGDLRCLIATTVYMFFADDEKDEKLKKAQEQFKEEVSDYNDKYGTNISETMFAQEANRTPFEMALGKVTGNAGISSDWRNQDATLETGDHSSGGFGIGFEDPDANSAAIGFGDPIGFGHYTQTDPRWSSMKYGKFANGGQSTLGRGGCGPTAFANAVNNVTGRRVTDPASVASYASKHGYNVDGGTSAGLFNKGAGAFGVKSRNISTSGSSIANSVKRGNNVVVSGKGGSAYTRAGHIMTVRGMDKRGNAIVDDPMRRKSRRIPMKSLTNGMTHAWSIGFGNGYFDEEYDGPFSDAHGMYSSYSIPSPKGGNPYTVRMNAVNPVIWHLKDNNGSYIANKLGLQLSDFDWPTTLTNTITFALRDYAGCVLNSMTSAAVQLLTGGLGGIFGAYAGESGGLNNTLTSDQNRFLNILINNLTPGHILGAGYAISNSSSPLTVLEKAAEIYNKIINNAVASGTVSDIDRFLQTFGYDDETYKYFLPGINYNESVPSPTSSMAVSAVDTLKNITDSSSDMYKSIWQNGDENASPDSATAVENLKNKLLQGLKLNHQYVLHAKANARTPELDAWDKIVFGGSGGMAGESRLISGDHAVIFKGFINSKQGDSYAVITDPGSTHTGDDTDGSMVRMIPASDFLYGLLTRKLNHFYEISLGNPTANNIGDSYSTSTDSLNLNINNPDDLIRRVEETTSNTVASHQSNTANTEGESGASGWLDFIAQLTEGLSDIANRLFVALLSGNPMELKWATSHAQTSNDSVPEASPTTTKQAMNSIGFSEDDLYQEGLYAGMDEESATIFAEKFAKILLEGRCATFVKDAYEAIADYDGLSVPNGSNGWILFAAKYIIENKDYQSVLNKYSKYVNDPNNNSDPLSGAPLNYFKYDMLKFVVENNDIQKYHQRYITRTCPDGMDSSWFKNLPNDAAEKVLKEAYIKRIDTMIASHIKSTLSSDTYKSGKYAAVQENAWNGASSADAADLTAWSTDKSFYPSWATTPVSTGNDKWNITSSSNLPLNDMLLYSASRLIPSVEGGHPVLAGMGDAAKKSVYASIYHDVNAPSFGLHGFHGNPSGATSGGYPGTEIMYRLANCPDLSDEDRAIAKAYADQLLNNTFDISTQKSEWETWARSKNVFPHLVKAENAMATALTNLYFRTSEKSSGRNPLWFYENGYVSDPRTVMALASIRPKAPYANYISGFGSQAGNPSTELANAIKHIRSTAGEKNRMKKIYAELTDPNGRGSLASGCDIGPLPASILSMIPSGAPTQYDSSMLGFGSGDDSIDIHDAMMGTPKSGIYTKDDVYMGEADCPMHVVMDDKPVTTRLDAIINILKKALTDENKVQAATFTSSTQSAIGFGSGDNSKNKSTSSQQVHSKASENNVGVTRLKMMHDRIAKRSRA